MSKTWVYSDPHFGHANICKFSNHDGSKLRPWDDVDKMDEDLIEWFNELVNDQDRVYFLGDIAFTAARLRAAVGRMKGRKVLVPGNHEPKKLRQYIDLFDDVRGYVQRQGFIMSHIPIHPESLGRWRLNIHGHLHANVVNEHGFHGWNDDGVIPAAKEVPDLRYYCACIERTNFRPIELDQILSERGLK